MNDLHQDIGWYIQRVGHLKDENERLTKELAEANGYRHQLYEALRLSNVNYSSLRAALEAISNKTDGGPSPYAALRDAIEIAQAALKG